MFVKLLILQVTNDRRKTRRLEDRIESHLLYPEANPNKLFLSSLTHDFSTFIAIKLGHFIWQMFFSYVTSIQT